MSQDFDQNRAGGQKPRRDGEQRSLGRRDDDRSRNSNDRPRFNRENNDRTGERPRFNRADNDRHDRRSDGPDRFDRTNDRSRFTNRNTDRDDRRGSAPTRFSNQNDRFGSERRHNDQPDNRPSRFSDRTNDRSEGRDRDEYRDTDRPRSERNDRPYESRPRFNDRNDGGAAPRRSSDRDDRRSDGPARFDRNRDDRSNRYDDRPRFGGNREDRGRNDRPEKPAFKRVGGFQPDADERNREDRNRNNRYADDRPRFDRSRDNRRDNDRDSREGSPYRFTPEQRKESGERRTGRYDKAPNYNLEQRPYERRGNDRYDKRDDRRRDDRDRPSRGGGPRANDRVGQSAPDRSRNSGPRESRSEEQRTAEPGTTRLNRYIANSGVCSRREADELIAKGDISVNGQVITEMGFRVKEGDTVKYGTKVLNPERFVYVLLNKPKDYITTTDDPEERKTVMELVADAGNFRLYPVGRLDRKTTGLLLLTNDGELADKLTHPSNNVRKIYQVEIDKPITEEHFEALQRGIELEDGPIKPDALSIVTPDAQVIGIEIHSGRNRIVRRMFEHFGYEVTKLDRTTFAGLTKKELPRGKWRFLDPKEVVKLKYLN